MFALLEISRVKYFLQIIVICVVLKNYYVNSTHAGNRKVYYFEYDRPMKWVNAFSACKSMNMTLFTVRNKDEFDYLKSLVGLRYGHFVPFWLDAYKLEGVWKWISTGDDITQFFWHEGEPNDNSGHEKCIHTWDDVFDWNDNDCERELRFICEAEDL